MADDLQQEIKEEIKDEPQDDDCPVTEEVHNDDDDDNDNDNENDNAEMNEDDNSQDTKVPSNGIFIRLRGLPWDVTKQDIVDFLADANVVDGENGVYICKNRKDDKMTGEAFVNLESPEDEEEAFRHNKQDLGHRYIEIFKATADEVNFAMNRSKHRPSKVVKLRGLPFSSTFDTIEDFFKVEMMEPDSPAPHSPPPKADTTKKKYKNKAIWSVEQEDYLLRLWEENLEGLRTNRRNSFIIQQMCDAMKREGFYFSPKEITIKIHNMKGKYKRELKGFKESGLHFSDWIHFRRVQKLMETPNPLQSPPHNSIEGLNVDREGIVFTYNRRGRATGEAYVPFITASDAQKALERNREKIENRYIEIFPSSLLDLKRAAGINSSPYDRPRGGGGRGDNGPNMRNRRGDRDGGRRAGGGGPWSSNYEGNGRRNNYGNNSGNFGMGGGGNFGNGNFGNNSMRSGNFGGMNNGNNNGVFCIRMRGLPYRAYEDEISDFFAPLNPASIDVIHNNKGLHSGTANVYFASADDAILAMRKHNGQMGSRYIELFYDGNTSNGGRFN